MNTLETAIASLNAAGYNRHAEALEHAAAIGPRRLAREASHINQRAILLDLGDDLSRQRTADLTAASDALSALVRELVALE